jgi:hypothetical protein
MCRARNEDEAKKTDTQGERLGPSHTRLLNDAIAQHNPIGARREVVNLTMVIACLKCQQFPP